MANGCLSHGGILVFHLFGELPDHLIKRVVDRFVYEPVAGIGIEIYLVPILLVEVKSRLNGRISLPQLDGPLRVTLHNTANILPMTLKTRVLSSNGKDSSHPFFVRQ